MNPFCYVPKDKTSILIDRYISFKSPLENKSLTDKFIPDGHSGFVFHFGEPAYYYSKGDEIHLPDFFITKPFLGHLNIRLVEPHDSFIVIVKSSVLTRLFDFSFEKVQHNSHMVFDIFKDVPIWEMLSTENSFEKRIKLFSDYLNNSIVCSEYEYDKIDNIYMQIMNEGGTKPIKSILRGYDIDPRSFRRNFIKRVGITSKGLSRIARVHYYWKRIQSISENNFKNLIFECRYCDQAHFINDFKEITGETPNSFFNRDLSTVKFYSGKLTSTSPNKEDNLSFPIAS